MKKHILLSILVLLSLFSVAFAHPGRTDSDGGHHVTATGEYHYHHGYPEHQHPNGICPYRNDLPNIAAMTDDYEESYSAGYNDGYDEGYGKGYDEGYWDGYDTWYQEGYSSGNGAGYSNGYDQGHEDGYREGDEAATNKYMPCIATLVAFLLLSVFLSPERPARRPDEANPSKSSPAMLDMLNKRADQLEDRNRYLEHELAQAQQKQADLKEQLDAALTQPKRLAPPPQRPEALPLPKISNAAKPVTFGNWPSTVHDSEKQFQKFMRANMEPIEILERDGDRAHILGGSGHVYATSLNDCNCPDFNINEHRKAPCKHIYFLAIQTGIPVDKVFEDYIKP